MTLKSDVEALKSIPLFAKIEPARLKLLAFTSEHLEFLEGDTLCRQGEPGDAAYIVLDGSADILVDTPQGQIKVAGVGRNDIVGEVANRTRTSPGPALAVVAAGMLLTTICAAGTVVSKAKVALYDGSSHDGIMRRASVASNWV